MTSKETVKAVNNIIDNFNLDTGQMDMLADSAQLVNILLAAHVGRWDQVTLMLIQEKVIEKWPS